MKFGGSIRPGCFPIAEPLSLDEAEESIRNNCPFEVGAIGYVPSIFCLMNLPHANPKESHYSRRSGLLESSMVADPTIGLPYGRVSRLMLIWLITQSKLSNSPIIDLGTSQAEFFNKKLGINASGGKTGTITRYADQLDRLFRCLFTILDHRKIPVEFTNYLIAHKGPLFSMSKSIGGRNMIGTVQVNHDFYIYFKSHAVPVDLRAVAALESTYALDLYFLFNYRLRGISKPLFLSWSQLMQQLGYAPHEERTGPFRACKHRLIRNIEDVRRLYPAAQLSVEDGGLLLHKSEGSVPRSRSNHR